MEKQESRRTQMTRRLIRSALVELMEEKTLERITIKELCERADVNRTTFYLHYSDQRSVLNDIKETVCKKTVAMITESDFTDPTAFVEQFLCYIRDNDRVFRILLMNDEGDSFRFALMDAAARELVQYIPVTADPQADAFGRSLDKPGDVRHHEAVRSVKIDNAEVRIQRRKVIIRNLRLGRADS